MVLISKVATYNTSFKVRVIYVKMVIYENEIDPSKDLAGTNTPTYFVRTKIKKFNNSESRKRGECQTFVYDPAGNYVIKHFFFN